MKQEENKENTQKKTEGKQAKFEFKVEFGKKTFDPTLGPKSFADFSLFVVSHYRVRAENVQKTCKKLRGDPDTKKEREREIYIYIYILYNTYVLQHTVKKYRLHTSK